MIPRHIALLSLAIALAGCDDSGVSNVARRLVMMSDGPPVVTSETSMLVEIHGTPWPDATPAEITGTMKMPQGPARGARFVAVAPGESRIGGAERLVFHFNPVGTLDSEADCRATTEIATRPATGDGFTLHATYCRENDWLIRATLKSNADARDWLTYHLEMEELLAALFSTQ